MTIIKVDTQVGTAITKLTEPLGNNNWTAWKTRIVSALKVCCVMEYVQGGIPMPDVENSAEDLEAWNFNNSYAQTIILNNISDNQLVHAQSTKNAKETWDQGSAQVTLGFFGPTHTPTPENLHPWSQVWVLENTGMGL